MITEGFDNGFDDLSWETGGDANWTITDTEYAYAPKSARSGVITHSQDTWLQITLLCYAGDITFRRKISSESNYDFLKFYIDDVEKKSWSGLSDWGEGESVTPVTVAVTAGTHTFRWVYSKDSSDSAGSDAAWIDAITFPADEPSEEDVVIQAVPCILTLTASAECITYGTLISCTLNLFAQELVSPLLITFGFEQTEPILNSLADKKEQILRSLNQLLQGDPAEIPSRIINSLLSEKSRLSYSLNELADACQTLSLILNTLSDTNPAEQMIRTVNSLTNEKSISAILLNELADKKSISAILLNELADTIPAELIARAVNSLTDEKSLLLKSLNELADTSQLASAILNELSAGIPTELMTRAVNSLVSERFIISQSVNTLAGYNVLYQNILNELSDSTPTEQMIRAVNSLTDEKSLVSKSLNQLADRMSVIQKTLNELSAGVPTEIISRSVNSLVSEQTLLSHILNTFAEKSMQVCQSLNMLSEPPAQLIESLLNDLSDFEPTTQIFSIINEYETENAVFGTIGTGDDTTSPETDPVLIPSSGISTGIITSISNDITQYAVINNDGSVTGSAAGQIDVQTGEWITPLTWENPVDIGTEITSTAAALPDSLYVVPYDIFFDGVSVKNRITKCQFSHRRDVVHNEITIESMDQHLKAMAQKDVSKFLPRFEIHIPDINGGTRFLWFLLEKIGEPDEIHFSLYGRSLSALEDEGFNDKEEYFVLGTPTSAKTVAESLLKHNILEWNCPDWILPAEFEYEGPPIVGVQKIAEAAGCILRAGDDDTLIIEPRKKERPIDMPNVIPDLIYDRSVAMSISSDDEKGEGYDLVDVIGWAADIESPDIEQEEDSPVIGQPVHLRVFWNGKKPTGNALKVFEIIESDEDGFDGELIESATEPVETFVTAGKIADLGLYHDTYGINPETEEQQVYTFSEGKVSVEHPIAKLESVKFIGNPVPPPKGITLTPSFEKYSKDITLGADVYVLANIVYKSEYQRYICYSHKISVLLALWMITNEGISATVKIGNGENPAPAIEDNLLTSHEIIMFRAQNFLDNSRYDTKKRSARVPFMPACRDGAIAFIHTNITTGNHYINSVTTEFNGPQVVQNIETEQCLI